jgi:hypothetical protein
VAPCSGCPRTSKATPAPSSPIQMGTSCSSGDANDKTARRQNDGLVGRRWARRTAHLSPAGNRARDTERRFSCGGRSVPVRSTPARVTLQRQYRSADPRRHRNAIRARTRAQIESTQIVRPRPHRTRGRLVEGVRGTGDLSTLGHRDGGAPELAICSMHARTEGVPERARDRATPVPPNAGMMAHGVAAHPLRASLCGLAATGNRLSASGQFAMAANISLRSAAMVHVASDECCPPGGRRGGARRSAPEGDELGDTGWMRKRSFG